MDEMIVTKGMIVRCNRCDEPSPFPKKQGRAIRENSRVWRLQTMAVLDCGHMDAHWVFDTDLKGEQG
jgi:hypothetical protein